MKDEIMRSTFTYDVIVGAKTLSDQELDYLLEQLQEEREKRKDTERLADWKAVCDAIDNFTSKWGSLFVQETNNLLEPDGINVLPVVVEGVNLLPGKYSTDEFGVITAKH